MNALLSKKKLLGHSSDFDLPPVIWQDNSQAQNWMSLDDFGNQEDYSHFHLGKGSQEIQNRYSDEDYNRFAKSYQVFKNELFEGKTSRSPLIGRWNKISLSMDLPSSISTSNLAPTKVSSPPSFWTMDLPNA